MRFSPNTDEIKVLQDILYTDPEYDSYKKKFHPILFSDARRYNQAYLDYRHLAISPRCEYLDELKERYPMIPSITGTTHEPISRSDVIVHLLEIPLGEVPLYMNSGETLVRNLAAWRLERGE